MQSKLVVTLNVMRIIIIILLTLIIVIQSPLSSQICDNFYNQMGISLNNQIISNSSQYVSMDCCATLQAVYPQIPSVTTQYTVTSIPFAYPYPLNAGQLANLNVDDQFSAVIDLPFKFCFFGQIYTHIVIGANGRIAFVDPSNPNPAPASFDNWSLAHNGQVPSAQLGNFPQIMGVYHDIYPLTPNNSIRFATFGTSPCRKFVVSYNQIPMFNCASLRSSFQIVLTELTNEIEVYVGSKPNCSWNSNRAVIGIQSAGATHGIAAPGRNNSSWTAQNEAWKFTPVGPQTNPTIEWFNNGNLVSTDNSYNLCLDTPGSVSNINLKLTYPQCGTDFKVVNFNAGVYYEEIKIVDIVNYAPAKWVVITNQTNTPLEYSVDGINWQQSNEFDYLTGFITFRVRRQQLGLCEISQEKVLVSNIVTPNGDGTNDVWNIPGIENYPGSQLRIYDRYGKEILNKTVSSNPVWNVSYLDEKLPSTNYFYILNTPDGREFKGSIVVKNRFKK